MTRPSDHQHAPLRRRRPGRGAGQLRAQPRGHERGLRRQAERSARHEPARRQRDQPLPLRRQGLGAAGLARARPTSSWPSRPWRLCATSTGSSRAAAGLQRPAHQPQPGARPVWPPTRPISTAGSRRPGRNVQCVNANELASQAGTVKAANVVMLGAVSPALPFKPRDLGSGHPQGRAAEDRGRQPGGLPSRRCCGGDGK